VQEFEVHFQGPDIPRNRLRDLLAERVADVPAGGAIDWITYYFRDRNLAQELLRARGRGVRVRVTMEGKPRIPHANRAVLEMLSGAGGLGRDLRVVRMRGLPGPGGTAAKPQLHEKLYCFSHPSPVAYVGSFNPSGDDPEEDPQIIGDIGDQDRGHNVLVGLAEPNLVGRLVAHARHLNEGKTGWRFRFSREANRPIEGRDVEVHLWPRARRHPVAQYLEGVRGPARIRIAASHIRSSRALAVIAGLARRGATVQLLAGVTLRRIPLTIERRLDAAGIRVRRIGDAARHPMHLKFVLVESRSERCAVFGSFNWTAPSFWLNHEIGAMSRNPGLFEAFADRWEALVQ
jgi:phosphatidylserine/phosphatidylglycerophosphate/cardiolipin synthase-like enzyme